MCVSKAWIITCCNITVILLIKRLFASLYYTNKYMDTINKHISFLIHCCFVLQSIRINKIAIKFVGHI